MDGRISIGGLTSRSPLGPFEHADVDLPAGDRRLHQYLVVALARPVEGCRQLGPVLHFGHADARALAGGLDEHRESQPVAVLRGDVVLPVAQHDARRPPRGRRQAAIFFVYSLSMLSALAATPLPTYGISNPSSIAWTAPSSP